MDDRKTSLDDPEYAAFAWSRYWRIMRWMMLVAILCILVALGVLWWWDGIPSIHMVIATVAGIGLTVMLAAALMGLIFLSSGTGHDEQIHDRSEEHTSELQSLMRHSYAVFCFKK